MAAKERDSARKSRLRRAGPTARRRPRAQAGIGGDSGGSAAKRRQFRRRGWLALTLWERNALAGSTHIDLQLTAKYPNSGRRLNTYANFVFSHGDDREHDVVSETNTF